MNQLTAHVALLAPVPLEHLISGADVCAKEGKVAFGSRAFEAFAKLQHEANGAPCDVLIYASDAKASGPPTVLWRTRYQGFVEAKAGRHPAGMQFRPPTTAQYHGDNQGHWYIFWEVSDLRPLTPAERIDISKLKSFAQKGKLAKTFVPLGPLVVEALEA